MRVLVADDDPVASCMLESHLREWGYEPVLAASGDEAWTLMQRPGPPNLLILDWVMPGMDGVTLCRHLRGELRLEPLHIVMLTSRTEVGDIVAGLEAGADDYVTKPYEPAELRARLSVGKRILDLQQQLATTQKLKGALEMAGAVCHEINQPLQGILGFAELLLLDMQEGDPNRQLAEKIRGNATRLGELTYKIAGITRYQSKEYLGPSRIVDIDGASADRGPGAHSGGAPDKEKS